MKVSTYTHLYLLWAWLDRKINGEGDKKVPGLWGDVWYMDLHGKGHFFSLFNSSMQLRLSFEHYTSFGSFHTVIQDIGNQHSNCHSIDITRYPLLCFLEEVLQVLGFLLSCGQMWLWHYVSKVHRWLEVCEKWMLPRQLFTIVYT